MLPTYQSAAFPIKATPNQRKSRRIQLINLITQSGSLNIGIQYVGIAKRTAFSRLKWPPRKRWLDFHVESQDLIDSISFPNLDDAVPNLKLVP